MFTVLALCFQWITLRRSVFQSIVPTWFTIAFRIGLILLGLVAAASILIAPTENALQEGIVGGVVVSYNRDNTGNP